jgi:hemerythrin-like domain-containing protein
VTKEALAMDITELILDDHQEQRRLFALLEQIDRDDKQSLQAVWTRLARFLDLHADAEEELFYPALLHLGRGTGGPHTPEEETEDAIHDHNDIRDAVAAVATHEVGSDEWFAAIAAANVANGDHMAEEEREGLTDFRRHASLETRHRLGVAFVAFETTHAASPSTVDKDPEEYVEEHLRSGE